MQETASHALFESKAIFVLVNLNYLFKDFKLYKPQNCGVQLRHCTKMGIKHGFATLVELFGLNDPAQFLCMCPGYNYVNWFENSIKLAKEIEINDVIKFYSLSQILKWEFA